MALILSPVLQDSGIKLEDIREMASGYFKYGNTDLTADYYKDVVLDSGSAILSRNQSARSIDTTVSCRAIVIDESLGSGAGTITVNDYAANSHVFTFDTQSGVQFATVLVLKD